MKKFKYRLQPLLKARQHLERERQKKLAEALNGVRKQQDSLNELGAENKALLKRQSREMSGRLIVADVLIYSRYLLKLRRDGLATGELLKVFQREASSRQDKLLEATKERKRYELLEEKLRARHDTEVRRVETREGDETALNSYRLKRQNSDRDSQPGQ